MDRIKSACIKYQLKSDPGTDRYVEEREYRTRAYKQGGLPNCEQYWSTCYISEVRGFAKDMTSNVLRSNWRNMKNVIA